MNEDRHLNAKRKKRGGRIFLFPVSVLAIYCVFYVIMPDKTSLAIRNSGRIFLNIIFPMSFIFLLMLVLNLFIKPAHITNFLGRGVGVKGIILSTTAGIISMGPIYAWYPLLKELQKKGVKNSLIAIFLGNRAVKPFLLPMIISYFGWTYMLILTVFTILGSFANGYFTGVLVQEKQAIGDMLETD